ncbi:MAG: H(+)/Cl(-) exchange transporter ClcA [Helicobacteraceae bacterium]|nr:H(+)/Cl(-) exchange transporter ClcA [Helicobacteraceae bacterium]
MNTSKLLFLSALVGILIGVVGSFFHIAIAHIIDSKGTWFIEYWGSEHLWVPYVLSSTVMLYTSIYLVKKFAPEAAGSGIQEIEGILVNQRKMNPLKVLLVKFFGGILSLGGGMVMGREGPTIQMGGALGNLVSNLAKLKDHDLKMLIAAGAGAGLAVAFNAPLAGILFVLEEMRQQFKYNYISVQSLITASVSSVIVLHLIMGDVFDIPMDILPSPEAYEIWIFAVFGVAFGIFGFFFNKILLISLDLFSALKGWKEELMIIAVGALVGLLVYLAPNSVDGGFRVIYTMLDSTKALEMLLLLLVVRFIMTMLSYSTGAPGGVFAPMLALGTLFGLLFGYVANDLFSSISIAPAVFAVVGMGALFSSTVRAPLTGIVLVVELTQNYTLILPLIVTSLVATIVVSSMGGRPLYTLLLERTLKRSKEV